LSAYLFRTERFFRPHGSNTRERELHTQISAARVGRPLTRFQSVDHSAGDFIAGTKHYPRTPVECFVLPKLYYGCLDKPVLSHGTTMEHLRKLTKEMNKAHNSHAVFYPARSNPRNTLQGQLAMRDDHGLPQPSWDIIGRV
jgi:hypothetical protein